MSTDIGGKSAKPKCGERYKTMLKRTKAAMENNHTYGTKRQRVEFAQ